MLGAAAKRIVHPIRKPRNNVDEAIAAKPERDGAGRAICCVAPLANGAYHWLRVASCISSRRASVATTWDSFRGSLSQQVDLIVRFPNPFFYQPRICHAFSTIARARRESFRADRGTGVRPEPDRHQIQPRRRWRHTEGKGSRVFQETGRGALQGEDPGPGLSQQPALQGPGGAGGAAAWRGPDAGAVAGQVRAGAPQEARNTRHHRSRVLG